MKNKKLTKKQLTKLLAGMYNVQEINAKKMGKDWKPVPKPPLGKIKILDK